MRTSNLPTCVFLRNGYYGYPIQKTDDGYIIIPETDAETEPFLVQWSEIERVSL